MSAKSLEFGTKLSKTEHLEPLTALSLFSGAGGLDLGVRHAGFSVLAAVEIDKFACQTLRENDPSFGDKTKVIEMSVLDVDPEALRNELGLELGQLDLLVGGPPCQSFSLIGKQKGIGDERGLLVFQMPRFAAAFRPKFVMMEQVTGFLSAKDETGSAGGVRALLENEFKQLGYSTSIQVLNAANYGVAQLRKRVFLVAHLDGFEFSFPDPTHHPTSDMFANARYMTVAEAIAGLGTPKLKGAECDFSHVDVTPARDRERISYVKEGEHLAKSDAPPEIKGKLSKKDTTKFLRLRGSGQSNTLRCGEIFYHPVESRYLTPREYMRIHSYPDTYKLCGPIRGRTGSVKNLDQHRQVANSVPPRLAETLADAIKLSLRR